MHFTLHAAAALLIGACAPAALVAPAFAQTCACSTGGSYVIQADEAPPPLPEYDQPPLPAPGYYWTPGYWAWNNVDYYWVPGVWVEPPQPGLLWTPGYWGFVGGVYAFRPGYWGTHIGFYGGINYGFGYTGRGYEGGRWQGQNFFYNTAVNNIRSTQVTTVYNSPVVVNNVTTINRVSFNGGRGGVVAAPTPQESLAASEPHVPPTQLQRNQIRAASIEPQQFRAANQGKPAVAAMPRPGAFNGKDVVPAKAAGSAQVAPQPVQNAQPPEHGEQKPPPGAKPPGAGQAPAVQPPPAAAPKPEEKPIKPEATPNAPKVEEKAPAPEKPIKPEAIPNAPKVEEKPPAAEKPIKPEATPNAPKVEEKAPAAEKPVKPEPAPVAAPPKPQPAPQAKPQPAPPPPAAERKPPPPERKPAPQCGKPGQPACPK
jgi:hypothetical protein